MKFTRSIWNCVRRFAGSFTAKDVIGISGFVAMLCGIAMEHGQGVALEIGGGLLFGLSVYMLIRYPPVNEGAD